MERHQDFQRCSPVIFPILKIMDSLQQNGMALTEIQNCSIVCVWSQSSTSNRYLL